MNVQFLLPKLIGKTLRDMQIIAHIPGNFSILLLLCTTNVSENRMPILMLEFSFKIGEHSGTLILLAVTLLPSVRNPNLCTAGVD